MPYVDHAHREIRLKVVYYGPGLGGKTTNLEYIHRRSRPEHRGKLIALNTEAERTLFFDLLPVDLGRYRDYRVRLHLCTVPGQIAHDETRRLILRHVDGIVFVVDSQRQRMHENTESLRNLQANLELQGDDPSQMPVVVQYNKRDLPSALPVPALAKALSVEFHLPQVEAVASEGKGVFETLKWIVKSCLDVVRDPVAAPPGRSPSIVPGRRLSMFPEAIAPGVHEAGPLEPEPLVPEPVPD